MANNNGKSPLRQIIRPGLTFVQVLDHHVARELYHSGLLYWLHRDVGLKKADGQWPLTFDMDTPRDVRFLERGPYTFGVLEED